ncbi:DUF6603 domain-containing protein [Nitrospira japonica]|uniref:DUF6603 domain-containing protein n=1 Tax=Nitrospira japonica TaxID=1325564 RepID=UPI0015619CA1|nr:DUF6603 domain-containing protein [Nitrospira japonica]
MITIYLKDRFPLARHVAVLLTLIEPAEEQHDQNPLSHDRFHIYRVIDLVRDPKTTLCAEYVNALATTADAGAMAKKLFLRLARLFREVGVSCCYSFNPEDEDLLGDAAPLMRYALIVYVDDLFANASAEAGVVLGISSADQGDLGLVMSPFGSITSTKDVGAWTVSNHVTAGVDVIAYGRHGITLSASTGTTEATASFSATLEGQEDTPGFVLGAPGSTRIEVGGARLRIETSLSETRQSLAISADVFSSALIIAPANGDGFLSSILPANGMRANFDLGLAWSNERGLTLRGSTGLDATLPIGLAIGGLKVPTVHLRLHAGDKGLETEASATLVLRLGPVEATIERVGLAADLTFPQTGGNLGVADLDFRFKPPTGVGLTIDAGVVHGGGFLSFDPQQAQYAGVLYLEMQGGIAVRALGLIHTRLPGGQNGFSLVVVITAEGFKPIPLGLGFMLRGIGGLLGIHRTANEDAIQLGMRANTLDGILAPADPVRNGPQYLSALNTVFPPAQDHHLFGPVVQITWGTPPLAIIRLAFIVEFGVRTRALMVGHLSAILPRQELDLVRLQMYVFGGIDFAQERAFLDAVLHDSRLLNKYVITGEMRMRMTWNRNPSFILAIGGVHPDFTPPPGLEPMPRLAIVLANSDDLKLRCEAYFAITSNTVQFGAHVHLFAKKSKFSVEGMAGFDVLIQFNPFHFVAALHASLELKAFGRSLFMVSFEGELSGPRPLHVRGKATFKIWIFRKSVSFDTTLIEGESPPVPESTDVARLLREALSQPAAWSAALPRTLSRLVSLREIDDSTGIRMHPLGLLTIKQNVVPLNLLITRFGTTPVAGGPQEFQIQQLQIGIGGVDTEPVRDHFAPAQFRDMSDDEKLSSPSFELLEAGIQATTQQAEHGAPLTTTVEYEEKIIPKPAGPPPPRHTMDAGIAARLSRWSAAGLHAAKHSGPNRYRAPALKLPTRSKIFRLVSKSNLTKRLNSTDFVTYAEADAAKRKLNFTEQAGLQIVAVTP